MSLGGYAMYHYKTTPQRRRLIRFWRKARLAVIGLAFVALYLAGGMAMHAATHTPSNCILLDEGQVICE